MSFRFNCTATLYKELGRYDAIVEFTEVSVRQFLKQANASENFNNYLQDIAKEHSIRVNEVDLSILRARISTSYILSVYQTTELFLRNYLDEFNELFDRKTKLDDTSDNLLIKTIKAVTSRSAGLKEVGEHRAAIFNYYRVVRNKYSHDVINETKVEKAYASLLAHNHAIKSHYANLDAPNKYEYISFDDFILFSRTVKDIADSLDILVSPSDEVIANYYVRKNLYIELNQNLDRKTNAVIGHMRANFGIEKDRAKKIVSLIVPLA